MDIDITDVKVGKFLVIGEDLWQIIEANHIKPGKGAAFVRARLKNIKTDLTNEKTFRNSDRIEEAFLEEKKLQYSYNAGDVYHFMDQENFDEVAVSAAQLGNTIKFLQDNMTVFGIFYKDKIVKIIPPNFLVTQIVETEPGIKGDSSRAGTKSAKVDTGASVQVPLFIGIGDWIKLDTRDGQGQYVERVNK